jgi:elongation factor G
MGDLSARRGQILGSEPEGRLTKLKAVVPEAEMFKYATQLHSITHGRATYRARFKTYAEVPPEVAQKISDEYKKEHQKELVEA